MKAVVAIDSFKGSLSSLEAGDAVRTGILQADSEAQVIVRPLADGGTHGIPEILATAVTLLTCRWKKQMMLSMAAGTILYMILVQVVFA